MFPNCGPLRWVLEKTRMTSSREFKNTYYNVLTGFNYYTAPAELKVPAGCHYNPYVRGLVAPVTPFLKDNMLQYEDGVKASVPQMALDLTTFLSFFKYGTKPDKKQDVVTYSLCGI